MRSFWPVPGDLWPSLKAVLASKAHPMNASDEQGLSSVSRSRTEEEIGDFWDTHSLADYWDETHEVEFELRARRQERVMKAEIITPPRHIVWSTDRVDLADPFQRRWYIRQVLLHGRAEDVRTLDLDELALELDNLRLPPNLHNLWQEFLESRTDD